GGGVSGGGQHGGIGGGGEEENMCALGLELLDDMVEFGANDALLRPRAGLWIEPGEHENVVEAVGLRPFDVLGLLHAMAGHRQHHEVARLAALHEMIKGA